MKVFTIIRYDFKKLTRDKLALMFMVAMPVVFTLVLGTVFGATNGDETINMDERKLAVAVTDHDMSELSGRLLEEFDKDESTAYTIMDEDELRDNIKNAYYEVGFIVPEGFEKSIINGDRGLIYTVKLPTSVDFAAIQGLLSSAFSKIMISEGITKYFLEKAEEYDLSVSENEIENIRKTIEMELQEPDKTLTNKTRYYKGQESFQYNAKAQLSMGYLVMFVMFAVVFGAGEILDERKINTWDRLAAAPIGMGKVIWAKLLSNYIRGMLQVAFLILFGAFALGVSWGNSIFATILLSIAFLFAATGLGTLLSSIVRTNSQLGSYGTIVLLVSTSISGCWWPIELSPDFMQKIAVIFPQFWAMKGYKNTVVANLSVDSVVEPIIVLMIMAAVFYTITILIGGFKFVKKPIPIGTSLADD